METIEQYELNLQELTSVQYSNHLSTFEEYKALGAAMLKKSEKYISDEDVLMEQEEVEDFSKHPDRYVKEEIPKKRRGKIVRVWYDLWEDYEITPKDLNYDFFFALKLRNLDLLKIDAFLDYQLEKTYEGETTKFTRFLQLVLRKFEKKVLQPDYIQTAMEWISEKQKQTNSDEKELSVKSKGIRKREPEDKLTKLNQEQTALLIHYLQKGNIIFSDENLNKKQAGQVFSILTGFSADSLRQNLSKTELERIATKKNLIELSNVFTRLGIVINNDLKEKNKSSKPS